MRQRSFFPLLHFFMSKATLTLAALSLPFAIPQGTANGAAALPRRFLVFPWGENATHHKGNFVVNETTALLLGANQRREGYERVTLDFEHNTAPVMDPVTKEMVAPETLYGTPRVVAGYGTLEVVPPDATEPAGIYLTVDYTPEGLANAANYECISPTPITNKKGEVILIHSVALCRQGEVPQLKFPGANSFTVTLSNQFQTQTEPESEPEIMNQQQLTDLLTRLGVTIPAGADTAALSALLLAYQPAAAAPVPVPVPVPVPAAAPDLTALAAQVTTLAAQLDANQKATLVAEATRLGKAVKLSADAIAGMATDTLRQVLDALPAGAVPTAPAVAAGSTPPAGCGTANTLHTLSAEVRQRMGLDALTPEQINTLANKYVAHATE